MVALIAVIRINLVNRGESVPGASTDLQNLSVTIDGETFLMSGGVAEAAPVPGSVTRNTVEVVGSPVLGDVDDDGDLDAALLLRNDPGGSGTFFYAVIAVRGVDTYRATNALPIGDRITMQAINFVGGRFRYNYLDRAPGESMAAQPSVGKSLWIDFDTASGMISAAAS